MNKSVLRIGCVPYLNGRPLVVHLEQPHASSDVELTAAVPSRLAELLDGGALDVALLSSIEAFRQPGRAVVEGVGISSDGPIRSVRVLSDVQPERIAELAVDSGSLTSVALAGIVLAERYGVRPAIRRMEPDVPTMLRSCGAALVIGDVAMRPYRSEWTLDLGQEWKVLTGLPFVYALWIARNESVAEEAGELLRTARDEGQKRLREIAREWAKRTRTPEPLAEEYLLRIVQYDLDDRKKAALEAFRELCRAHGVSEKVHPIRYC